MTGFIVLVALVIAVAVCKGVLRKNTTGQQEGQEWYIDFAKKSYSGNGCFYTESIICIIWMQKQARMY